MSLTLEQTARLNGYASIVITRPVVTTASIERPSRTITPGTSGVLLYETYDKRVGVYVGDDLLVLYRDELDLSGAS